MDSLKDIISSFKVNTVDERNLLNSNEAPNVFYKVAECMLAGHFLVTDGHKDVLVRPTVLEFYYHEEKNGGIKDPIVYHPNPLKHRNHSFRLVSSTITSPASTWPSSMRMTAL